jgi:hypothetical protein
VIAEDGHGHRRVSRSTFDPEGLYDAYEYDALGREVRHTPPAASP